MYWQHRKHYWPRGTVTPRPVTSPGRVAEVLVTPWRLVGTVRPVPIRGCFEIPPPAPAVRTWQRANLVQPGWAVSSIQNPGFLQIKEPSAKVGEKTNQQRKSHGQRARSPLTGCTSHPSPIPLPASSFLVISPASRMGSVCAKQQCNETRPRRHLPAAVLQLSVTLLLRGRDVKRCGDVKDDSTMRMSRLRERDCWHHAPSETLATASSAAVCSDPLTGVPKQPVPGHAGSQTL